MTTELTEQEPLTETTSHLSASQLRTYASCSLQWYFSRRYEPESVAAALVFGRAIHEAIQGFYQCRLEGITISLAEMMRLFDGSCASETKAISFNKTEDATSLREKAERMLQTFLKEVQPGEIIGVEEPFTSPTEPGLPPLTGRIDLLEIRTDLDGVKRLHLVDFKTAATRPSTISDLSTDQLILYALAAQRTGLLAEFNLPLVLRYDVLTKTKSPEMISLTCTPTKQETARVIQKARLCWQGMKSNLCLPSEGWQCSSCGYKSRCAQWPG